MNKSGIRILLAVDGSPQARDAVAAVSRRAYDLVLMDIEMPEMDGITATAAIRRDPAVAELPIIAMTAHATGGEQERFRAAGMTDYLTKPFKPQDLVRLVEGIAATPSAARASVDLASEYPAQQLCPRDPARSRRSVRGRLLLSPLDDGGLLGSRRGGDDQLSQARARREAAMIAGEVEALGRYQGGETSDELRRAEEEVRGAVAPQK